jgi:Fe2+ or Zn2+ uptake regulation protein
MSIEFAAINRTFAATFEQRNLRYTARRGTVLKALLDATEPITFRELHRLINRKHSPTGFTTVVHIVNLLVGCRLAREVQQQRNEYRCPRCLAPGVVAAPHNWRCANCRQTGAAAYPVMVSKAKKRFLAVDAPCAHRHLEGLESTYARGLSGR